MGVKMSELPSLAKRLISEYYLCNHCLGRMFGGLSTGLSNEERGWIIREYIKMDIHKKLLEKKYVPRKILYSLIYRYQDKDINKIVESLGIHIEGKPLEKECEICGGLFNNLNKLVEEMSEEILKYEFNSYVVGVESYPEIEKREERLKEKFGIWFGENIRSELSREIGKYLEKYFKKLNREIAFDPKKPEATIIFNLKEKRVSIETRSIQFFLKIRKTGKLPIFAKTCKFCKGRGCESCDYLGREKGESLEYLVGKKLIDYTGGIRWKFSIEYLDENKRDINVYIKIISPKKRSFNAEKLIKELSFLKKKGFKVYNIEKLKDD